VKLLLSSAEELLDRLLEDESQRAQEVLTARARMCVQSSERPKAFAALRKAGCNIRKA
jgi:hypothetical protein